MKDETIARCLLSSCLLAAGMEKSIAASGTILEKPNYTAAIATRNQTNEHTFDYSGETAVKPINSLVIAAYEKGAKNIITVKGNPSLGEKDLTDANGEASLKDARGEVLKEPAHWTIEKTRPIGVVNSGRYNLPSTVENAGILFADKSYEAKGNNITLENVSVKNTSSKNAVFANDTLTGSGIGMSDTTLTFKGNNYLYTDGTRTGSSDALNGIQLFKNNQTKYSAGYKNHTKIESEAGSNLNIYVKSGRMRGRGISITQYKGVTISTSEPRKTVVNQTEMDFRGGVSIKVDRGDEKNAENYGVYVGNLPKKSGNSEDVPEDSYNRATFHSDVKIDVQPVLEESGKQKSIGDALNVDGKNSRVDIKGDGTVQIDGDIHVLNGGVIDLNLKNKNSYLNGEAHIGKRQYTGDPDDPDNPPSGQPLFEEDRKDSASSINMTMKDGARWNVQNTSKINGLDISNGAEVSFSDGGRNVNVSVSSLKGNGGVFKMQGNIVSGKSDKLITREGSEGVHIIEYEDNAKAPTTGREFLKLVENQGSAGGGASYKLHVRCTEHGAWCFKLGESENSKYVEITPDGKRDFYLYPATLSTGASSSVLFGEALYQLNAVSDETLVQRMGEIHADGTPQEDNNVWLKRVGGKFAGSRSDYRVGGYVNRYWGFAGGFNRTGFGDKWIHYKGLMLRHLQSSYTPEDYAGSGKIYGRTAGVYSTWLNRESRAYYDLVANIARYKGSYGLTNYSGVRVESDEARLNAYMLSAETGRRMEKQDGGKTYWWQPEAQLSYWFTRGYGFSLSNGLSAETDNFRSLLGRFGFRAGVDGLDGGRLNIYGKLMYKREFIGTIRHRFNGSAVEEFKHRGGWLEYGLGVVRRNAENGRQLYFEAQRSSMHTMRQNWQVNMGVRSMF
ncbi:autotransporter outer membrane beta-barrel domain-containing protein [Neisseria blantyrii]|uniref:autotransporter outer membrane beta-barrel domain-containing protein n=1 Tax=Neisseria blantyrii TaxID=2830647 RepID=UPI00265869CC|nr:autotransporter outer membrane beta-barrel domain-containing protein [Neisseria blantyrii]